MDLLVGFVLAILIAILAQRAKALSRSGAWAAAITGGLIFGLGGLPWAVLLLTFFISSSALSRAFRNRKASLAEKFAKGNQRDWAQVLANGGIGTLLAIGYYLWPNAEWLWLAFAGAMAAVNADTWSTELGVLSKDPPRMITSGKKVEPGSSGGISLIGTLAAAAGAALIGVVAVLFSQNQWTTQLATVIFAGLLGSLFDSFLGATVQAIYWCPSCQKETEHHLLHSCGTHTIHVRGWSWVSNEVVNFACSLMGAVLACGTWLLLSR